MKWYFVIEWKDDSTSRWNGESKSMEELTRLIKAFVENFDNRAKSFNLQVEMS